MTRITIVAWLVVLTLGGTCQGENGARHDNNVPQFLAGRTPVEGSTVLPPDRWSATENIAWKTDLAGLGWGSPIVWNDRLIVTTCVNTGVTAEPRKGLYLEDVDANKYPKPKDKHEWRVLCLDLKTGSVLWQHLAYEGVPAKPHHIKNTLASETAATDGERIYAYFGNVGLFCYDMDGKPLWKHLVEPTETRYGWGTSTSPIVYRDRVYVVNDNEQQSYLLALDKRTGDVIWKIDREDEKTNYATPFVWENDQRTELVTSGIGYSRSYDLDGKLLWKLKGSSILSIPTPFAYSGNLYLAAGHVVWGENPVYAIKPGANGDISLPEKETTNDYIAWSYPKAGPYHPTPLIYNGRMYILYDRGFMAAYDAKTGREIYPRKRIPNGKAFTASPWAYPGKIFGINEDGVTFVFKEGPEFEIEYTNELAPDDMGMATPVIVGDRLVIRTSARVYCVGSK
jgi:outer membrane protein assembly factor BamB